MHQFTTDFLKGSSRAHYYYYHNVYLDFVILKLDITICADCTFSLNLF